MKVFSVQSKLSTDHTEQVTPTHLKPNAHTSWRICIPAKCKHNMRTPLSIYVLIYAYTYMYIYITEYMYSYRHINIYIFIYIPSFLSIYAYIYTHINY